MSNDNGSAQVINLHHHALVTTATAGGDDDVNNDDMRVLRDVVRRLPPHAVKDLLSTGVCVRCIIRLFGIREQIYSCSSLSESNLCSVLGEPVDESVIIASKAVVYCNICLGILQFTFRDDKETSVKMDSAREMAVSIAEVVKKGGHCFHDFSLEVSVPPIILENEHAALLYMKRKYGHEPWMQEKFLSERVSAKEALKFSIVNHLETLLNVQSGPSCFRIRLTYTHSKASKVNQNLVEKTHVWKRRRQGMDEDNDNGVNITDLSISEADAVIARSFKALKTHEALERFKFPPEKANESCHFTILCYRTPIYFGGRYLKYSRNVSQTRWIIDDERMGEASVEEIIGGSILPLCQGDNYKFHAAGREDIDVRMLGSGRPFLVEIQNARQIPSEMFIKELEAKMNNSENKLVRVKNLKELGSQGWDLMREGEAEKQKEYVALVWISRQLEDADIQTLSLPKEMPILQRTPIRVLHRRSPLEREKIIHWMKIERLTGSSQYFLLHLCTQAGTYIKEFVHGDLGRTHPSIGSILGCRAEILQLDVTDVKMDCFLTE